MIQHFVLTRFNIASPGREMAIRNSPGWLNRRFDLFDRYCLPSMAAQDRTDFHWLIYFDKDTPPEFKERIERARQTVDFEPRYVGLFHASMATDDVQARTDPAANRILTTRLDNDDAVAGDFLSRVRAAASSLPDSTVINFTNGIALKQGRLYAASDESNPFTSLIEPAAGAQTIWSAQHRDLGRLWTLKQIQGPPCWLQVVHGENVANRIKGRRLEDAAVLASFTIDPEVPIVSTGGGALLLDRLIAYPLRCLREAAFGVARNLRNRLKH